MRACGELSEVIRRKPPAASTCRYRVFDVRGASTCRHRVRDVRGGVSLCVRKNRFCEPEASIIMELGQFRCRRHLQTNIC